MARPGPSIGQERARQIVDDAVARRPEGILLPLRLLVEVLRGWDLPVLSLQAVASVADARAAASGMGYPVVLRSPEGAVWAENSVDLERVWPSYPEIVLHASVGPLRPALMWTPSFAAKVAALRLALPEIDDLDLTVEIDGAGRPWIVEAKAHVRALDPDVD